MAAAAYEGWAIVDLFGHVKLAGKASEAQQYGTTMLRIDVPSVDGSPAFTRFIGGSAIYSLTPTTQELAEGVIRRQRPEPVSRFDFQLAPALGAVQEGEEVSPRHGHDGGEDDGGDFEVGIDNDDRDKS